MPSTSGFFLASLLLVPSVLGWSGSHGSAKAHRRDLRARRIISDAGDLNDSYDFIIAGGGTAGMVLAARLTEDSNHTVLVLEAGQSGLAVGNSIDVPGNAWTHSLLNSDYDWAYKTVAQPKANNRELVWPRGKVLGGSSAINGLYMVRPSKIEYDTWASLMDSQDGGSGASSWNWDSQFAAMKKGETFTPPTSDVQTTGNILYDESHHGKDGPVHASYPGFMLPVVENWVPTLQNVGIPESPDPSGGENWGTFVATSAINPTNWTRSHARAAYIDPLPPRSNLDILTSATVTRIVFDPNSPSGNLTATGVEFATSRGGTRKTIKVLKEVILAGGAIGSPNILMHSGVGPADVLKKAGVDVLLDIQGVGQHMQDHVSASVTYKTNAKTVADYVADGMADGVTDDKSSPFLSFINSATCYVNLTALFNNDASSASYFQNQVMSQLDSSASTLVPSQDPGVIAGYKAIYAATADKFLNSPLGHIELLLYASGVPGATDQSISVQVALQHPFSHGRLYISTDDPFDYPVIDPQYFSHSADLVLFRQGLKLARQIGQTAPLKDVFLEEIAPGPNVATDAEWETYASNSIQTEYHPANTLAMLPKNQGGVVDSQLRVYGLANVRVVDASVFPIQFAAHLQWAVYGLGEEASTIIRNFHNGVAAPGSPSNTGSGSTPSSTRESSNGAMPSLGSRNSMFAALVFSIALAFAL